MISQPVMSPSSSIVIARYEAIYFAKSMREIASANEEFASHTIAIG